MSASKFSIIFHVHLGGNYPHHYGLGERAD